MAQVGSSARVKKLLASAVLVVWLKAGNAAAVWSWAKRVGRWECRRQQLQLDAVEETPVALPLSPGLRRGRIGCQQGLLFG
jgi:hypothetical protein